MKKTFQNNKDLSIFMTCATLSFILWLSMSLSRTYLKTFYFPVEYKNLSLDKKINSENIALKTILELKGWDILFRPFGNQKLIIDLKEYPIEKEIKFTNTRVLLQEKFKDLAIMEVSPLFFTLNIENLESKKVPIRLNLTKNFKSNFFLSKEAQLSLDSILISSDASTLKNIDFIETIPLEINEEDSVAHDIELMLGSDIRTEHQTISATFEVEEYIEKKLIIKIAAENLPPNIDLIFYPDEVELKCLVPISIYENINASDFYISADFNNIVSQNDKELLLSIKDAPSRVKNLILSKEKVEFIIYQ